MRAARGWSGNGVRKRVGKRNRYSTNEQREKEREKEREREREKVRMRIYTKFAIGAAC